MFAGSKLAGQYVDAKPSSQVDASAFKAGMVTKHRKHQMPQIPINLDHLPDGPEISDEELSYSTPYSDRMAWVRMLSWQIRSGTSRLQGPPGLLDKMVSRLSSITAQKTTLPPST